MEICASFGSKSSSTVTVDSVSLGNSLQWMERLRFSWWNSLQAEQDNELNCKPNLEVMIRVTSLPISPSTCTQKTYTIQTSNFTKFTSKSKDTRFFYRSSVPLIVLHKHALHKHSGSYSLLRNSRWVRVYFNSLSWVTISINRVPYFTSGLLPLQRRSATCTNFPRLATTLGALGQCLAV